MSTSSLESGGRNRWISKFKVSLVYKVSFRATKRNPVWKKQTNFKIILNYKFKASSLHQRRPCLGRTVTVLNHLILGGGEIAQRLRALGTLHRTQVQFPAPSWCPQPSVTLVTRDPMSSSGLHRHCALRQCMRANSHTHKRKVNKSLKKAKSQL